MLGYVWASAWPKTLTDPDASLRSWVPWKQKYKHPVLEVEEKVWTEGRGTEGSGKLEVRKLGIGRSWSQSAGRQWSQEREDEVRFFKMSSTIFFPVCLCVAKIPFLQET